MYFITGEWGSSVMRLSLCRRDTGGTACIAHATGPGVVGCDDFETAFFVAAQPWLAQHGVMPVILAGMIGANIGWRDTGYVACPAQPGDIAAKTAAFTARGVPIHIAPGLRCENMFGLPDVMRGEDMQIMGWLARQARAPAERHVLCLPGRHVKWVLTRGDAIDSFFTGMNGEMEELLLRHSLLGRGVGEGRNRDPQAFNAGMSVVTDDPTLSLGHALFATRSRLVLGQHGPDAAASFLSGLLTGADVRDAVAALRTRNLLQGAVMVLGTGGLAGTYAAVLEACGCEAVAMTYGDLAAEALARVLHACEPVESGHR